MRGHRTAFVRLLTQTAPFLLSCSRVSAAVASHTSFAQSRRGGGSLAAPVTQFCGRGLGQRWLHEPGEPSRDVHLANLARSQPLAEQIRPCGRFQISEEHVCRLKGRGNLCFCGLVTMCFRSTACGACWLTGTPTTCCHLGCPGIAVSSGATADGSAMASHANDCADCVREPTAR